MLIGGSTTAEAGRAVRPTRSLRPGRLGGAAVAYFVTLLFLLWPFTVNGGPFYMEDSTSYLRGGALGFHTGLLILDNWWQSLFGAPAVHQTGADPHAVVTVLISQSGGVRSLIYSVVTYILRGPYDALVPLVVVQTAAVALVISFLKRLVDPDGGVMTAVLVAAGAAFLTSAPWYAAYAVPDILAGVMIAGAVALTVLFERTTLAIRSTLVLLVAFCMTTHGSHLPLGLCVLVAGASANFWLHRNSPERRLKRLVWFSSPFVLAVAALLGTSYFAFGQASLSPKRYPILLARSVADGPGAWYLREHCATERYAICEVFGPNPPRKVGDFLWSKGGVRYHASPEQMERIRAEESVIVRRAAFEYPVEQFRRSAGNGLNQLVKFGPQGLIFGVKLVGGEDPTLVQVRADRPLLRNIAEVAIYFGFAASIMLLLVFRGRLTRVEIAAVGVATVGLIANAAICGALSGVTDRYQGRVAWVLPVLAMIILLRALCERRPVATSRKVALA